MKRNNILVIFDDETRVVYSPQSSVRIANRGPSDTRIKDYEQVQTRPPLWFGFQNFEARILAAGHHMLTHRGFRKVVEVKQNVDLPEGDQSIVGQRRACPTQPLRTEERRGGKEG